MNVDTRSAYRITVDGKQVIAPSKLGIRGDGVEVGQEATIGTPKFRSINETYRLSGHIL